MKNKMMKNLLIIGLFAFIPSHLFSMFGGQNVISTDADDPKSVYAADVDGDGDMDVLSASKIDDKIAWYENFGDGNFGGQHVISTDADNAWAVHAADIDGDGDLDVLSISQLDDKLAWYENTVTCPSGYFDCAGECDCAGNVEDECGICGGDNSSCEDCAGVLNGDSVEDECGVCDGDGSNCSIMWMSQDSLTENNLYDIHMIYSESAEFQDKNGISYGFNKLESGFVTVEGPGQ